MSCSDIQVTILGDISGVTVLVDEARQAATDAAASAVAAKADADRAAADSQVDGADLETGFNYTGLAALTKAYNFKGSGVTVTQTAPGEFDIIIPGENAPVKISDVTGLKAVLDQLQASKIDEVTGEVDAVDKIITLKMKSGGQVVKTNKIDLLPMFATVAPSPDTIYFGYSTTNTVNETIIKQGAKRIERSVKAIDLTLVRQDTTPKYMFVWVPDVFGTVVGFKFSGSFVDVWQSSAVTVNGVAGKVYVSDNATTAKSVTFEVEQ